MADKTTFYAKNSQIKVRRSRLIVFYLVVCCLFSSCFPREPDIRENWRYSNNIQLINYCGYPVYFSVVGFTDEKYMGRGADFNTASEREISPGGWDDYVWVHPEKKTPTPPIAVKDDFRFIVKVRDQDDRIYTQEEIFMREHYSDGFIDSTHKRHPYTSVWGVAFCPDRKPSNN